MFSQAASQAQGPVEGRGDIVSLLPCLSGSIAVAYQSGVLECFSELGRWVWVLECFSELGRWVWVWVLECECGCGRWSNTHT